MISISMRGDDIVCLIPSSSVGEQTVVIPMSLEGLRVLRRILSAPSHHSFGKKLGTDGEPTQALVNEWLRAERQRQLKESVAGVEALELEIEL